MISNEMRKVSVLEYSGLVDSLGQKRTDTPSRREVEMVIKPYNRYVINTNVIYDDITDIGLTFDRAISDKNQIKDGDILYDILYVIPSRRCHVVLMKKH